MEQIPIKIGGSFSTKKKRSSEDLRREVSNKPLQISTTFRTRYIHEVKLPDKSSIIPVIFISFLCDVGVFPFTVFEMKIKIAKLSDQNKNIFHMKWNLMMSSFCRISNWVKFLFNQLFLLQNYLFHHIFL